MTCRIADALFFLDVTNASRYYRAEWIKSFRDAETERLWKEERMRRIPADLRKPGLRKLQMLNAATALADLLAPPGNRLERLHGDREGQHSIRINDQFRICFAWRESNAFSIEITDYH